MTTRMEIFRSGTHTAKSGLVRDYTQADLDAIVTRYNNQPAAARHDAPLVIGHPSDNAPAYGWVVRLDRDGDTLYAESEIGEEMQGWLAEKLYRKRSISLYPDGLLRHVGFLGAAPPAVKGLRDVAFAEGDATEMEFAEAWTLRTIGGLFRRLREWIIDSKDLATADSIIPSWDIEAIDRAASEAATPNATPEFSEPAWLAPLQSRVDTLTDFIEGPALATLRQANAEQSATIAGLRARIEELEFTEWLGTDEMRRRVTPAMRDHVLNMWRAAVPVPGMEYSEGDTPRDHVRAHLAALPTQLEFREVVTQGADPEPDGPVAAGARVASHVNRQ